MFKDWFGLVFMKIDLHMHSIASDGKLSPRELVDLAIEKKIPAIAITDHEVMDGSREAIKYAKGKNIEVVSGVEIGADDEEFGLFDVHIVGLFLDLDNKELLDLSARLMLARETQKRGMIQKLGDLGYEITFEELKKEAGGINYGRPHLARILVRKYDEFEEVDNVFDKLLGYDGIANVRQEKESIKKTIDVIHSAGGVAILAHPMLYDDFEKVVDRFIELGGDGVEVDHSHVGEDSNMYYRVREIARDKDIVVSGGGDFHSKEDSFEVGDYGISMSEFEKLKKYWERKWKKD